MGASIASRLARAGFDVVLCDLDAGAATAASQEINGKAGREAALALGTDVTDEDQVSLLVRKTIERFGRISVLINNAGILFPTGFDRISLDEWRAVVDVNLTGTFLCSRAVVPSMRKHEFGRIVNMSSSAGRSVSTLGGAHYTAAKAGVLGLTRAMAKELAASGILVNSVCPGLIDTGMVRGTCDQARVTAYEKSFPVQRLGRPDEVAAVVEFLCTDATYVTGAAIDVNGGDLMI